MSLTGMAIHLAFFVDYFLYSLDTPYFWLSNVSPMSAKDKETSIFDFWFEYIFSLKFSVELTLQYIHIMPFQMCLEFHDRI